MDDCFWYESFLLIFVNYIPLIYNEYKCKIPLTSGGGVVLNSVMGDEGL